MSRPQVYRLDAAGGLSAEQVVNGLKLLIIAASAAAALAVSLGAHAGAPRAMLEAQNAAPAQLR